MQAILHGEQGQLRRAGGVPRLLPEEPGLLPAGAGGCRMDGAGHSPAGQQRGQDGVRTEDVTRHIALRFLFYVP